MQVSLYSIEIASFLGMTLEYYYSIIAVGFSQRMAVNTNVALAKPSSKYRDNCLFNNVTIN
jgi:hypothetical protein